MLPWPLPWPLYVSIQGCKVFIMDSLQQDEERFFSAHMQPHLFFLTKQFVDSITLNKQPAHMLLGCGRSVSQVMCCAFKFPLISDL